MRILTLGIIFFVLVASICVSQAVEPKLLWCYKADAGMDFEDVVVSANGEYVAAGSASFDDDNTVYFFNREGELLWSYETGGGRFRSISISADGEYVAAGNNNGIGKVYFFNRDGELLWSYDEILRVKGGRGVEDVAISADGEYIAVGIDDSNNNWPHDKPTIYFFNREGELLWSYKTCFGIDDVAISADGEYIAAGSDNGWQSSWGERFGPIGGIYFFNRDGELLWSHKTDNSWVTVISISADGEYIAVGNNEGPKSKVYFFNRDGELLWSYKMGGSVVSLSMSADGEYIAVGDETNKPHSKVYFLNRTGDLLWSSEMFRCGTYVSVSADGEYIAAGGPSLNDNLYFFNRAGELLWSYKTDFHEGISVSADGKYVVTGLYCEEVYFLDSGVITTPSSTSTPEHSSPAPETPSYEAIFAITGLLPVAYLLLRRRRDRAKRG